MAKSKDIKCVVWDLDNTIWEGTLSEEDDVRLKPGIREIIGELDNRGILHSIASKNNHDDAWKKLVEYQLDHFFLYPQIHWNAKSYSIADIRQALNIGLDTMMFVDDLAFERDEVATTHPEVLTFDAHGYLGLLDHGRLNPRFVNEDSRRRRLMYQEDRRRNMDEKEYKGPQKNFLASLHMEFVITEAVEGDLQRAEELTERTNQLNATGQTYDYDELFAFMTSEDHKLYVCELTDRYGSHGKIGLALVEIKPDCWHLKLLLMSCRVLSKGVGSVLMTYILNEAKRNSKKLMADFKHTDRNRMMYLTYKFSDFKEVSTGAENTVLFENDLTKIQPWPPYIHVKHPGSIVYK